MPQGLWPCLRQSAECATKAPPHLQPSRSAAAALQDSGQLRKPLHSSLVVLLRKHRRKPSPVTSMFTLPRELTTAGRPFDTPAGCSRNHRLDVEAPYLAKDHFRPADPLCLSSFRVYTLRKSMPKALLHNAGS